MNGQGFRLPNVRDFCHVQIKNLGRKHSNNEYFCTIFHKIKKSVNSSNI